MRGIEEEIFVGFGISVSGILGFGNYKL